jgi:C1A family cysteine protease
MSWLGLLDWFSWETATTPRVYKWKRDHHDNRDAYHDFKPQTAALFMDSGPTKVDLRDQCPAVYDQGALGSCTANAIGGAIEYDQKKQNETLFVPARLFIYWNERNMEGSVGEDAGAQIRDGIKSINSLGVCPETEWPYDISKFTKKPSEGCYKDALLRKSLEYKRVLQDVGHMRECLKTKLPFVFGFVVFPSFEDKSVVETGDWGGPTEDDLKKGPLGGHAVMAVGYDDDKKAILVRNSWGEEWGDKGYFWLPYDFITNREYANDFWTVSRVM